MGADMEMNENEDMTVLTYGRGEDFYCRYEGESSQRHLKESRMNMASKSDWAMRGGGWIKREREERGCLMQSIYGIYSKQLMSKGNAV